LIQTKTVYSVEPTVGGTSVHRGMMLVRVVGAVRVGLIVVIVAVIWTMSVHIHVHQANI